MKKSLKVFLVVVASISVLFSACKSEPEPKPVEKPKPKVEKPKVEEKGPSQAELDAAREKQELLAELERLQAENGPVQKARERAIELGADKSYPEEFAVPENLLEAAKADIEAENLKEAVAKLNESIMRYDTLSNLMLAAQMKAEIEENNFSRYASEDFEEAEKMKANTLTHYELDHNKAKESSDEALEFYKKVINQGYYEFAKDSRARAEEAKSDCDSIKVARSRTKDYNFAVRLFAVGKTDVDNSEYKKAYEAFTGAADKFTTLYEEVSVRRAEAEIAMAEAAKKQEESSNLALEADKEAPLTEPTEGFNDGELELEDKSSPKAEDDVEPNKENDSELDENTAEVDDTETNKDETSITEIVVEEESEEEDSENTDDDSIIKEIEELGTEEHDVEISEEDLDMKHSKKSEIEEVEMEDSAKDNEVEEVEIDSADLSDSEIEIEIEIDEMEVEEAETPAEENSENIKNEDAALPNDNEASDSEKEGGE